MPIFLTGNSFAQDYKLSQINISIPMLINYSSYTTGGPNAGSQSGKRRQITSMGMEGRLQTYSRNGNSFFYEFNGFDIGPISVKISFNMDSSNNKLTNFSYSIIKYPARGSYSIGASFSDFDFTSHGDSGLTINDSGSLCLEKFLVANYATQYQTVPGPSVSGGSENLDSVITSDTASFKFSITLDKIQPVNSVSMIQNEEFMKVLTTTSNSVRLNFTTFCNEKLILFYDILGREIDRVEIPSTTYEYTLNTSHFTPGHYFARLGNMTGHFVVY
jgi:hypothetical protein